MQGQDIYLTSIGAYLPPVFSTERAVAEGLVKPDWVADGQLTGVRVAGDEPAPEMAVRAVRQLFDRGGDDPAAVDLIIYASVWHQGPDGWGPQSYVQRAIGGDALAVELRHGCTGGFSAMQLASGYLRGNPEHTSALIVGAENFGTAMIDRWSTTGQGMLVGDGASAVLLSKNRGFAKLLWADSIAVPELEEMHRSGEPLFPPGATTGRQLDFSDRNRLFLQSGGMEKMRPLLAKAHHELYLSWTGATGLSIDDVTYFGYMNTSLDVIEKRLLPLIGLPPERTTWELGRDVGHLGISDQLVALDRLLADGSLKPGDHYLMNGLGPGMTVAGALVEILDVPGWVAR
ncbi:ketoacyl-ACP synthase III family protein [Couchioplanes caeruleus]|uniref:ketoacyl-ACP synthase III family protein n=1 Tax=Couchioplanes caeruleus TaxID=56438 RepID=UPI0020BF1A39|nr:ketoacyl-ACP synthase III family protein [Couchioplanes caeruleus]UQU67677.1 ketoacyl-ACP synthase III family protein [Couchioplanes caeruleus]